MSPSDKRLLPIQQWAQDFNLTVVVGAPVASSDDKLHIGAICLLPNSTMNIYTKHYLHPGEEKFFSPGTENSILTLGQEKIALAICADISNPAHPRDAAGAGASIYAAGVLITDNGYEEDTRLLQTYASQHKMTVFMANYSGHTGGYRSAGKSAVWDDSGRFVAGLEGTEEAVLIAIKTKDTWHCKTWRI